MTAVLFVNRYKAAAISLSQTIERVLKTQYDIEIALHPEQADIAFSIGGDGTVLRTAQLVAPFNIPLLTIHLGTLGFIAAVTSEQWQAVFEQWLEKKSHISRRSMLEVTVERQGSHIFHRSCLNDAVITSSGIAKMINLTVNTVHARLGTYRSDGLIVATPTGSTAYSVSAGGPIVDPELEAIIVNPICPFALANRPIVMATIDPILIEVSAHQRTEIVLTLDGQVTETLKPRDHVQVSKAPYCALLIAADRTSFYRALYTKLAGQESSHAS
ncbi:MAG: NAD(+)/NADH kinase [Treponema sp.]|jgi:NAD+ kinase|nr:NAD(+)/NADH kinase [Treponema sp.]